MTALDQTQLVSRAGVTAEPVNGRGKSSRASQLFNLAMFVVGGIALAWMLSSLGWDRFLALVASVGGWFAVIILLDLASLCCDAAALHAFMRPEARMIKYTRVLAAQASGRAINVLTPGGALGEPLKLTLLADHAPRTRILSSVVLLNLAQVYLSAILVLIGTPITFLLLDLPRPVTVSVAIGLAVIVAGLVAIGVFIRRGATASVVDIIHRLRLISDERAQRWKPHVESTDRHIRELYRNRSAGTWKGLLWVGLSKVFLYGATITLLVAVDLPLTPALIVGVFSVGVVIQWISSIVPMGLGLADGGNYAMYALLGATGPHGVAMTMLNRARSVTIAVLGLGALAATYVGNRMAAARIHKKLEALRRAR